MPIPHNAKITKTALRQATICVRVSDTVPVAGPDVGAGWDTGQPQVLIGLVLGVVGGGASGSAAGGRAIESIRQR
jgi:hypothetical protein